MGYPFSQNLLALGRIHTNALLRQITREKLLRLKFNLTSFRFVSALQV